MPDHTDGPLRLDAGRIAAAVIFVDKHGLRALTMRRLGQVLGVEAMSLYRHVHGKEHLLDTVAQFLADGLDGDADVLSAPRDGWQDFVQRLAHGVRRVSLEAPWQDIAHSQASCSGTSCSRCLRLAPTSAHSTC